MRPGSSILFTTFRSHNPRQWPREGCLTLRDFRPPAILITASLRHHDKRDGSWHDERGGSCTMPIKHHHKVTHLEARGNSGFGGRCICLSMTDEAYPGGCNSVGRSVVQRGARGGKISHKCNWSHIMHS